jgi:hypothetical protein
LERLLALLVHYLCETARQRVAMAEGIGEAIQTQISGSSEVREPLHLVSTAVRKIKQAAIALLKPLRLWL